VLFLLDCCRIAENSWFMKHRENGMEELSYREIAQRMFALADGAVMSAKKDALVNMGGFLALRDEAARRSLHQPAHHHRRLHHVRWAGRPRHGSHRHRSGEVFDPHYLDYRIRSTTCSSERNCTRLAFP
jgi:tryptophanase